MRRRALARPSLTEGKTCLGMRRPNPQAGKLSESYVRGADGVKQSFREPMCCWLAH
jgi:hypothetical protein